MHTEWSGRTWLNDLGEKVDREPQVILAALGVLVGYGLVKYGCYLIKPAFVTSCSGLIAVQAYFQCRLAPNHYVAAYAPGLSVVIGLITLKLWHLLYPGFLFLVGCVLGGCAVFVGTTWLGGWNVAIPLLAGTVLGALLTGLSFVRFYNIWWRLVLPPFGSVLVAAGFRYFVVALANPDEKWTRFTVELTEGREAVFEVSGATFWTTWIISASCGWYLQLAPLIGLRQPPRFVPAWASRHFVWLFGPDGLLGSGVAYKPGSTSSWKSAGNKLSRGPLEPASKPLLGLISEDTDLEGRSPSQPEMPRKLLDESGTEYVMQDYIPEVALLVAVISVVGLNWLLMSQPVLVLSHAVLMSMAFLVLTTAGMVSSVSNSLVLPRLFGPPRGHSSRPHLAQGAFSGLALGCALAGYGCIFARHWQLGASQLGLGPGITWGRAAHVWIGYLVLLLVLIRALSGVFKLYIRTLLGLKRLSFQDSLGRIAYSLASADQLIAYTFPGLLPSWAPPLLGAMLIVTVGVTSFFVRERNLMAAARLDRERLRTERTFSIESGSSLGSSNPPPTMRKNSVACFEATLHVLGQSSDKFSLQRAFVAWHRLVQQRHIQDAANALQGQDRLVQFLSQELVDDSTSRRQ